jgi:hypothetical protein
MNTQKMPTQATKQENQHMNHIKKSVILLFLYMTVAATTIRAQTSLNLTSYLVRDDNAFNSRYASKEYINTSNLYLEHRLSGKSFQFSGYYSPDLLLFSNRDKLSNHSHLFGASGVWDKDPYTIQVSTFAKLRNYQEPYIYYNVNSYNLNASLQYSANIARILTAGLAINKDQYKKFSDLNNLTYRLYGKFQQFFQSRTSLSGEIGLGVKDYVNQSIVQYFGLGYGMGGGLRFREDPVRAAMFSASLTLGKSIFARTGLSLGLGGQWFIGDPIMAYTGGIYYYTENDLYDDPYAFQSRYLSLELTRQFAIDFQAKLGYRYQNKNYSGTPALDDTGNLLGSMRRDQRQEFFMMMSKKFKTGWKIPNSVSLFINLMYRHNGSNDPYFSYHDQLGLVGFSIGLLNPQYHF